MTNPNLEVLNHIDFISTLAVDIMKRNYASIANEQLFKELDDLCHKHVEQKLVEEQKRAEKSFAFSKTAQAVIQRMEAYLIYSLHKNNHKMRLTKKEYDYMLERLNDTEKALVEEWLESNGGFDKYIFTGFTGA